MTTQLIATVSVEQLVARILDTRQITRADQQVLLTLKQLEPREQALINRVAERLHMGLLKVVD